MLYADVTDLQAQQFPNNQANWISTDSHNDCLLKIETQVNQFNTDLAKTISKVVDELTKCQKETRSADEKTTSLTDAFYKSFNKMNKAIVKIETRGKEIKEALLVGDRNF